MSIVRIDDIRNLPSIDNMAEQDRFLVYRTGSDTPVLLSSEKFKAIFTGGGDIPDDLDKRIEDAEAAIEINSQEIILRVSQTVFDDLAGTVSSQGTQITLNAEQVALRATQETVDNLTGRVDSNEAQLTIQADQIQLRVTQETFDTLEGRVTAAESSITQNADQIELRVTQVDFDEVEGRLTTAESSIVQNADQIELRVTQTEFDTLEGRVTTAESSITQNADQIALRVTTTTFNATIEEVLESLTPAVRFQFLDSADGFTGENATLTNNASFLTIDATGADPYIERTGLSIDADDNPVVYLRARRTAGAGFGGQIGFFDGTDWHTVALTEPNDVTEWNSYRLDLSDNTDYTGTITGLRVYLGETADDAFDLDFIEVGKRGADALIIEGLDGRITAAEAAIILNANEIDLRVTQIVFDELEGRVEVAESSITQNANEIALRVTQTDFDDLEGRVSSAEASIIVNAEEIALRVTTTTFDELKGRVTTAESSIVQNANQIALRVTQSTFDNLENRVTTAEASIQLNADEIALRVTQVDHDDLVGRVTTAETAIIQNADEIALRATTTEVNALGQLVEDNAAAIFVNSQQIELRVTQTEFDSLTGTVSSNSTAITQNANTITNEVLADGQTRSRMTQDMDGFTFESNQFKSSNWNGTIDASGNMTNPGTIGWAFDRNGVLSLKQLYIAGFNVGIAGAGNDRFKAGDLELIGGSNPQIKVGDAVDINDKETFDFNNFLGDQLTTFIGVNLNPSQSLSSTFAMADNGIVLSEVVFTQVSSDLVTYPATKDFLYLFDIEIQGRRVTDSVWETFSAGRYDYGTRTYQDPLQGSEQDPGSIIYTEPANPVISAEPSSKYNSYRYRITNQSQDNVRMNAVSRKPILKKTEINKAGTMAGVSKAIKSQRIFASPSNYIDLVAENVFSESINRLKLVARFYRDNQYVGEEDFGTH